MALMLYDTARREKTRFTPLDPERVTLYVCGPTVYSYAHIGNARPAVVFDTLVRLLRRRFAHVVHVSNITDIDDKIIAAAREEGVGTDVITARYTAAYLDDMAALNVRPPNMAPRATEHVSDMIDLIERLLDRGFAYEADGHVLFRIANDNDYGALSHRDREELIAGARVEVAPYKSDPADFVLWKPAVEGDPGWDSPWGRGRPGWHTECAAMIERLLGATIDIHGGGQDLVFPHHENERAQATCAHGGEDFARLWMHNAFINIAGDKMAKSLGNIVTVHGLLEAGVKGEVIRYAILSAHYRQPLNWTADTIAQAENNLDRLYGALRTLEDLPAEEGEEPAEIAAALEDDLNTPAALAALQGFARDANRAATDSEKARLKGLILRGGNLLGLLAAEPEAWFKAPLHKVTAPAGFPIEWDAAKIQAKLAERQEAREQKKFAEADKIRDELAEAGVILEDTPDGTNWRRKR